MYEEKDPSVAAEQYLDALNAVVLLYRVLEDPIDKFIVMACIQLGYTQDLVALMLGVSQPVVSARLKNARDLLKLNKTKVIF